MVYRSSLGRVINAVMLIFFPIWWLVPTAMIMGDAFLGADFALPMLLAISFNAFYPFVFVGMCVCERKSKMCGPVYSCETGWKCGEEGMTELPPKHDVGFGLSIWMRIIPAIIVIGVGRLLGWIFFPPLSLLALMSGLGIETGLVLIACFLRCVVLCVSD